VNRKWSVRPYKKGDETGLFALWKAVYPQKKCERDEWMRWWHWALEENPAGLGITWLAEADDGRIVGLYRGFPMKMKMEEKVINAVQGVDSMTHPEYRRQGMNSALITQVVEEARSRGFDLAFAFLGGGTTTATYLSHIKCGYFGVSMQLFFIPLDWRSIIQLKINNGLLATAAASAAGLVFGKSHFRNPSNSLRFLQATSFDARFDVRSDRGEFDHEPLSVIRSRSYLNWRYACPGGRYRFFVAEKSNEVLGYATLGDTMHGSLRATYVYNLVAQSEDVRHALISMIASKCRLNNTGVILYPVLSSQRYHRTLNKAGFISNHFIKAPLVLTAHALSSSLTEKRLMDKENWFIQMEDSDAKEGP